MCQTEIDNKKVQSVKCKTIEVDKDATEKLFSRHKHGPNDDDDDSGADDESFEEDDEYEEISSKIVSVKQKLQLQSSDAVNINASKLN